MDGRKRGRGGRAKPTNEQRMESKDWKRFNRELERKGIRVENPKHPLADFPPTGLRRLFAGFWKPRMRL